MNTSALHHKSTADLCYAADNETAVIRLRTGRDVEQAYIICDDPFIHWVRRQKDWDGTRYPMRLILELEEHLIWEYRTRPPYKRLQYYFEAVRGEERFRIYDNRICAADSTDRLTRQCFKLPWMNPSDVIRPPAWVRDTVWYQIMPDRFCRGGEPAEGLLPWDAYREPSRSMNREFYGGDLKGVIRRLPYLQHLGINGLYFTPIFLSDSYHRYNTFDYNVIDPLLGSEEDMKELVRQAHERGIRIMLDGVFNHCGTDFFAWQDVQRKGRESAYADWFFLNGDKLDPERFDTVDGRYYTFSFVGIMPKLNTNHPDVIRYFCDICSHWVRDWGIDGIRFDVGDEVSHTFLRELRRTLKPIRDDLFLLGEIWYDSLPWLGGSEYDSVMNYPAYNCVNDFDREPTQTTVDFMHAMGACLCMYPEQVTEVLFNFIDTHDTLRIAEECGGNEDRLLQKLAMLLTLPGTPCLYYGTEIALRGREEWENRRCMPWDEIDSGRCGELPERVRELIGLRHAQAALKGCRIRFLHSETHPRFLHYIRGTAEEGNEIGVCVNAGGEAVAVPDGVKPLFARLCDGGMLQPDGTLIYAL